MTWARERRRAALVACAAERNLSCIAVGHHADDQVETILYRLLRGTGLRGLAGMAASHEGFVRPLLEVRRRDLLLFNASRGVRSIEDPSNVDRRFARNRLRHDVLPVLRRENPRVDEALLALAREARSEPRSPSPEATLRDTLAAEGLYAGRRALAAMLEPGRGGTRHFDLEGGTAELHDGVVRRLTGQPLAPLPSSLTLEGPGRYGWGERVLRVDAWALADRATESPGAACFDADRVPWPWLVRPWKPGDRMRPRGGRGSRKLSDLFIDARVPRPVRARVPVVVGPEGQILFVPGLRPADEGRPSKGTRRLVAIEVDSEVPAESPR